MNNNPIKTHPIKSDIEIEEENAFSKDSIIESSISFHRNGDYKNAKSIIKYSSIRVFSDPTITTNYGLI